VELLARNDQIGVTGFAELLPLAGRLLKTLGLMKRALKKDRPTALLIVDFPDFNLMLAKLAHRLGIRVIYYIPPQVWAWRRGRVKKLKRLIDQLIVIFPFEVDFYRQQGVEVFFAGHPFADLPPLEPDHASRFLAEYGLDPDRPLIGLLPGSRRNEIRGHMPLLALSARELLRRRPDVQFIMPIAPSRRAEELLAYLDGLPVTVVRGQARQTLAACRAAWVAWGTATLEAALSATPIVAFYARLSPITHIILTLLYDLELYSMPNLIAGRRVVPELLQREANPLRMVEALLPLIDDGSERQRVVADLKEVRSAIGQPGALERAADKVLEIIEGAG